MYFYLAQAYQLICNRRGTKCEIDPPYDGDFSEPIDIIIPDNSTPPDTTGLENIALSLSPELAMFLTYLLQFVIFHLVGLALCWACTISFRGTARR